MRKEPDSDDEEITPIDEDEKENSYFSFASKGDDSSPEKEDLSIKVLDPR